MACSATSEHPVPAQAVAECAGSLLETAATGAELTLSIVGTSFAGALGDISDAVGRLLGAQHSVGIVGSGALMGSRIARDSPALAVLAFHAGVALHEVGYDREPDAGEAPVTDPGPPTSGAGRLWVGFGSEPRGNTAHRSTGVPAAWGGLDPLPSALGSPVLRDGEPLGGIALGLAGSSVRVLPVHGTIEVAPAATVTRMAGAEIVALDGIPAAHFLESALADVDPVLLEDCTAIGFTGTGTGELIAARPTGRGLLTRDPVEPGQRLVPAVLSRTAARRQLAAGLLGAGDTTSLCVLDSQLPIGSAPIGADPDGSAPLQAPGTAPVGVIVRSLWLGGARGLERARASAVVLQLGSGGRAGRH